MGPQISSENIANALKKKNGNLSQAAKALKISRSTIYRRVEADPQLQEVLEDAREELIDIAEDQLHKQVKQGNVTAIIWTLKAAPAAKKRGWGERQEVTGADGGAVMIRLDR